MEYAAIGLSVIGFAVGLYLRLKALLLLVALLVPASLIFALNLDLSFLQAAAVMVAGQVILQSCYFLGLVVKTIFSATRARHVF